MKIKDRPKAFLVGPFVGELSWEFYRFAPYIIKLKKENPTSLFVIFTRFSRFDLYGKYANVFVPLRVSGENFVEDGFGLNGLTGKSYEKIALKFYSRYAKRFNVISHIYPRIASWRRRVKWQFPRDQMNFDFRPRDLNEKVVLSFIKEFRYRKKLVLINSKYQYQDIENIKGMGFIPVFENLFNDYITKRLVGESGFTLIGCLIELIKQCEFVVGNIDLPSPHLSLLLKTPVISVKEKATEDEINLLNPLDTPLIRCSNVEEGCERYENYI